jgi:DNA polymerase III subunit delta'
VTVLAPRENPSLLGHAAAEAVIDDAIRAGRIHHAWLLTGPEGVGKATLAYRFARRLLAGPAVPNATVNDPAFPVFRRVAAATHADLLTIEREWDDRRKRLRSEIVVDSARSVADFLRLTPAEAGWRIVVVDGAEYLNRNAANALLKVLEEPPARAVLLLVCASPGRLLPTIRSRCRRLRLGELQAPDMDPVLAQCLPELEPAARATLAALSSGSPGRAVTLAEEQGVEIAALVADVLRTAPNLPVLRTHEVADKLARSDAGFATFMDLLRDAIGTAIRNFVRGEADAGQHRLAALKPLAEWGNLWHALTRLQDDTERFNLDKRHAIVSTLDLLNAP